MLNATQPPHGPDEQESHSEALDDFRARIGHVQPTAEASETPAKTSAKTSAESEPAPAAHDHPVGSCCGRFERQSCCAARIFGGRQDEHTATVLRPGTLGQQTQSNLPSEEEETEWL